MRASYSTLCVFVKQHFLLISILKCFTFEIRLVGQRNRVLLFPFPRRQDKSVTFLYMCFDSSGGFYCLLIQFRRQTCSSYSLSHAAISPRIQVTNANATFLCDKHQRWLKINHKWGGIIDDIFPYKLIVIVSWSFPLNPLAEPTKIVTKNTRRWQTW